LKFLKGRGGGYRGGPRGAPPPPLKLEKI